VKVSNIDMEKWINYEFGSSSGLTSEFSKFASDFKRAVLGNLSPGQSLVNWSRGHFYVSGFINQGERFVYFSVSDVRHFFNDWYYHILVRTAKNEKDYTGGVNHYATLPYFGKAVSELLEKGR